MYDLILLLEGGNKKKINIDIISVPYRPFEPENVRNTMKDTYEVKFNNLTKMLFVVL